MSRVVVVLPLVPETTTTAGAAAAMRDVMRGESLSATTPGSVVAR